MNIKEFIKYLIDNKGFVVINGEVHRNRGVSHGSLRVQETYPYHAIDITYKWNRYNKDKPLTDFDFCKVIVGLDIAKRSAAEQKRLLVELRKQKESE